METVSTQTQELPANASRYAGFVPNGEPEVPAEIEQYLAELSASVAEWTRAMELSSDGAVAGAQYLQRAGARAAARLTMKVWKDGPAARRSRPRWSPTRPGRRSRRTVVSTASGESSRASTVRIEQRLGLECTRRRSIPFSIDRAAN